MFSPVCQQPEQLFCSYAGARSARNIKSLFAVKNSFILTIKRLSSKNIVFFIKQQKKILFKLYFWFYTLTNNEVCLVAGLKHPNKTDKKEKKNGT